jgi:hypothetical protein
MTVRLAPSTVIGLDHAVAQDVRRRPARAITSSGVSESSVPVASAPRARCALKAGPWGGRRPRFTGSPAGAAQVGAAVGSACVELQRLPSIRATVRSTLLMAIESPSAVPSSTAAGDDEVAAVRPGRAPFDDAGEHGGFRKPRNGQEQEAPRDLGRGRGGHPDGDGDKPQGQDQPQEMTIRHVWRRARRSSLRGSRRNPEGRYGFAPRTWRSPNASTAALQPTVDPPRPRRRCRRARFALPRSTPEVSSRRSACGHALNLEAGRLNGRGVLVGGELRLDSRSPTRPAARLRRQTMSETTTRPPDRRRGRLGQTALQPDYGGPADAVASVAGAAVTGKPCRRRGGRSRVAQVPVPGLRGRSDERVAYLHREDAAGSAGQVQAAPPCQEATPQQRPRTGGRPPR